MGCAHGGGLKRRTVPACPGSSAGDGSPSPLRARWPLLMQSRGEFKSVQVVTRALAFVGGSAGVSPDR